MYVVGPRIPAKPLSLALSDLIWVAKYVEATVKEGPGNLVSRIFGFILYVDHSRGGAGEAVGLLGGPLEGERNWPWRL